MSNFCENIIKQIKNQGFTNKNDELYDKYKDFLALEDKSSQSAFIQPQKIVENSL